MLLLSLLLSFLINKKLCISTSKTHFLLYYSLLRTNWNQTTRLFSIV